MISVQPAFSNSSSLKSVFEKVTSFREGLVWTVGLTVELKAACPNFSGFKRVFVTDQCGRLA